MSSLAIIDVETTGLSAQTNRIIEIGLIRVEDDQVVSRYSQLINPCCRIPSFIQKHTGITPRMIANAPTFAEVIDELKPRLQGGIFVAHNAAFDYSFIASEYSRLGLRYTAPLLCTAKLSRRLFPSYRHHSLDSIIERFGFKCQNRHRALDDAEIVWQFYQLVRPALSPERALY